MYEALMYEASGRTSASPGAIWAIVVVMAICTGILVAAPAIADSRQAHASRRKAGHFSLENVQTEEQASVLREAASRAEAEHRQRAVAEPVPAQRSGRGQPAERPPAEPRENPADAPTRPDLPPVGAQPSMPAQRRADADQAERGYRGSGRPDGR